MQLYEILELINHDAYVEVVNYKNQTREYKTVWELLGKYGGDDNIHCSEIKSNIFGDLILNAYDIRDKVQQDDELPFPVEEKENES